MTATMTTMMALTGRWTARLAWGLAALLAVAVALFSYRYLIGVGPLGPNVLANAFARPWLVIHIAGAATALLLGAAQFLPVLRRRWLSGHRWIGRTYAAACLVGGLGGLFLAAGSTAGPIAGAGFGLLAVAWIAATTLGWRAAMQRRLVAHRRWMIRSWALTLAAVTLRLYLPALSFTDIPFLAGYQAIAFLCWVPNLLAAELWLRLRPTPSSQAHGPG
jgi:hypothetical protein